MHTCNALRKPSSMPVNLRSYRTLVLAAAIAAAAIPALAVEFKNALDDLPLDLSPIKGETITDAVKSFYETGKNPYVGDAEATAAGKALYDANCQVCHKPDGSGGMGPSLIDNTIGNTRAGHRRWKVRDHSLRGRRRHASVLQARHHAGPDPAHHRLRRLAEEVDDGEDVACIRSSFSTLSA